MQTLEGVWENSKVLRLCLCLRRACCIVDKKTIDGLHGTRTTNTTQEIRTLDGRYNGCY